MSPEIKNQLVRMIDDEANSRLSAIEFEMAYQARVAMDRIRFAIKHNEHFAPHTDQNRETGMQLLDALQRLETVDRRFQERSRMVRQLRTHEKANRRDIRTAPDAND